MKNFALIGAAGYVAPRHLHALRETGQRLVAALDRSDSVGILDSYFPDAHFFTELERFDRHLHLLQRQGSPLHYVSVASPNYLHDAHCRFALRMGADAVCEKPLVINPWNLDSLEATEEETGHRVHAILQLRLHPEIIALKQRVLDASRRAGGQRHQVEVTYITRRGRWYFSSWKGDPAKSGGIVANIGVHVFDMLLWVFGPVLTSRVHALEADRAGGTLALERAEVRWFLSVNGADLPKTAGEGLSPPHRSIRVDGSELEFSQGFTDLHTQSYRQILAGEGFTLSDARPSIELVHAIRTAPVAPPGAGAARELHPLLARRLGERPRCSGAEPVDPGSGLG